MVLRETNKPNRKWLGLSIFIFYAVLLTANRAQNILPIGKY